MRAPFSEMLPETRGVSILTRGVAAIAVSRLTTGPAEAGWVAEGVLADGAGVPLPGVVCGVAPGVACCEGFASSACVWLCARCFSICGTL